MKATLSDVILVTLNAVSKICYVDCTNPKKINCVDNKRIFSNCPHSLLCGSFCSDFLIRILMFSGYLC